nr:uncharacterized protein CFP56_59946 [Quercus suber]
MVLSKPRVLSREEEVEILRSKKKVKDVHHADFNDGASDGGHSQSHQNVWGSARASFKEKLVGEMPGAFAKAFDFSEMMDADAESDDEVSDLREGLAAVKLSRETKLRIRGPWAQTLIVKLFGRSVGFNFLQSKLNILWKPSGRLDCVDLGNDFYSVRFALKEDLNSVLEKGPWFIGGHFLSIRPWEPFFKPGMANVSSIAVWVRLHHLPMELYEAEVLKQIGEALGKVLRIDAHTALEARGKYARLCIQVDINKPLINTVLIGKFEQQVVYEGIHKLCFGCGRIGHKKEACPHLVRKPGSPVSGDNVERGDSARSHTLHAMDSSTDGSGTSGGSGADTESTLYGPWMVVTRKKFGQRISRNVAVTEGPTSLGNAVKFHTNGQALSVKANRMGWVKEPTSLSIAGTEPSKKIFQGGPTRMGFASSDYEPAIQSSPSVRGKKGIARTRASNTYTKSAADFNNRPSSHKDQTLSWRSIDGIKRKIDTPFQFTASDKVVVGCQLEGKSSGEAEASDDRNQCISAINEGLGYQAADGDLKAELVEGRLEVDVADTLMRDDSCSGEKDVGGPANNHLPNGDSSCNQAVSCVQLTRFSKENVLVGEDGMELEKDGGVDTSSG